MQQLTKPYFFILLTLIFIALLYLLSPILTPFLVGALLAYLVQPVVKRLEKWKLPHLFSVTLIFLILLSLILFAIIMLIPLINKQIILLAEFIPQVIDWLQNSVMPWLSEFINMKAIKPTLTSSTLSKTGLVFNVVLSSGYALVGWVVNLVLTPVITFYLLCDWNRFVAGLKNLLPRTIEPTVVKLVKECDAVLGAFFKGQLLVMLGLCLIYGIGLSLIGLRVGLILGIIGGILSVVPYLGSIFVVISASIMALVQFGYWQSLFWVWGVFIIGQALESYVLTPYLIGDRIGLHPVAVIFAIMAGGALFGFVGVLLALPVAGGFIVFVRFFLQQYYGSKLYCK